MKQVKRPDRDGTHRKQFDANRKKILATQNVCGICGRPVDKSIPYPDPMSPCVDHIIPIAKGGHPSDIDNLQLAHRACNRAKSDKLFGAMGDGETQVVSNRNLPLHNDWQNYKAKE